MPQLHSELLNQPNECDRLTEVSLRKKMIERDDKDDYPRSGYGSCYACKKEGKVCGGFINDGKGYGNCKTCGHNFNQHA